jgi:hypothetical protein
MSLANQVTAGSVQLRNPTGDVLMRQTTLLGLACFSSVCSAQAPVAGIVQCKGLVISQQQASRERNRPFALDLQGTGGAHLVYIGVRHTFDPADTQWTAMESAWHKLQPTIAFYEGTGTAVGDSAVAAIQQSGEPGLLRFLASKSGVPARSLEPSREAEVESLLSQFSDEQLVMFYALRIVNELRTRRHLSGPAVDTAFASALVQTHRTPKLAGILPDTSALRAAFARLFPTMDPLAVPDRWIDPQHTSGETGSLFFNDVNRASSMFRDEYMYDQLAAALQVSGARVFAEVGRDHIPAQAAALRCVLGVGEKGK